MDSEIAEAKGVVFALKNTLERAGGYHEVKLLTIVAFEEQQRRQQQQSSWGGRTYTHECGRNIEKKLV